MAALHRLLALPHPHRHHHPHHPHHLPMRRQRQRQIQNQGPPLPLHHLHTIIPITQPRNYIYLPTSRVALLLSFIILCLLVLRVLDAELEEEYL